MRQPKSHILAEQCRLQGVYLQHEANFQLLDNNNANRYIRVGYSGLDQNQFVTGFNKITTMINQL